MKPARFWEAPEKGGSSVKCLLCPHGCAVADGKYGICLARKNVSGTLFSASYGRISALNLDPVEKKPLYHFYPGSGILSAGSFGCNLKCAFCQNWEISQRGPEGTSARSVGPQEAAEAALECGSIGIAYTYNEPLVNYEWVRETAELARSKGLVNVLVTNGYVNPGPLSSLIPFIDAANIDVKAFSERFYAKLCGARLAPVLEAVSAMIKGGKHVEVTTLLIPGENDSVPEIEKLADWLSGLDPDTPLHFSGYFPSYKMDAGPTGEESLYEVRNTARKKLNYVYVGNIASGKYSDTLCPSCGWAVIERKGYSIKNRLAAGGLCPKCGHEIKVISRY